MSQEYRAGRNQWGMIMTDEWKKRWPNFSPDEVACGGCGSDCEHDRYAVDSDSMDALQALRGAWGSPLVINSAYRCKKHNASVGGGRRSQHLRGKAFDVFTVGWNANKRQRFIALARQHGFRGVGRYPTFIHIDTRKNITNWEGK